MRKNRLLSAVKEHTIRGRWNKMEIPVYAFAFSRDGRRVAFTRGNEKQDAVMLSNFP